MRALQLQRAAAHAATTIFSTPFRAAGNLKGSYRSWGIPSQPITMDAAQTCAQPSQPVEIGAQLQPDAVTLRLVNRVFSRAAITDVCQGDFDGEAANALRELADDGAISGEAMRSTAISALSKWLSDSYRSEYIFKSTVANKLWFGTHSPRTTAMLQEFRVGRSKVDCVLVNGAVQAFEIKSGLDSPAKLEKQIADYRTVFPRLSVITDEDVVHIYEDFLADTSVGVVALQRKGRNGGSLSVRKPATPDTSVLSVEAMMRSLRKPEYTDLVRQRTGNVPDVPNTRFFAACLTAVKDVPPEVLHEDWTSQLRRRKLQSPGIVSAESMRPLRHICADINPDESEATNLKNWLAGAVA